jgi:hypothetical protein
LRRSGKPTIVVETGFQSGLFPEGPVERKNSSPEANRAVPETPAGLRAGVFWWELVVAVH